MDQSSKKTLIITLGVIIAITLIGFAGYLFGFLGFIYNVAQPKAFSNFNIVLLSVIFGIAAYFSPCAFTVLPAYITHYLTAQEKQEKASRFFQSLYLGFLGAVGIIVVNMIVGLVIAALGSAAPFHKDPRDDIPIVLGVRILVGVIITILGIMTVSGKTIQLPFLQRLTAKGDLKKSMFFYGIFYNTAALGCTGPIMLGLMLYALSSGSFTTALLAFTVFSFTMGTLMILVTVLVGAFKGALITRISKSLPTIKMIAGIIMIIVGLFLVILTLEGNNLFVKLFFPYLE